MRDGGICLSRAFGDVSENPHERGSRIGHVRIEAAFFFPKLADPGALLGFEPGHDAIDVRLVVVSVIAFGKRILVDACEELRGLRSGSRQNFRQPRTDSSPSRAGSTPTEAKSVGRKASLSPIGNAVHD